MTSTITRGQFIEAMNDCRRIYVDNALSVAMHQKDGYAYIQRVENSFTQLLVKIFVEVAWTDFIWSEGEVSIARTMVEERCLIGWSSSQKPDHGRNFSSQSLRSNR